jgi:hypothetical protein
MPARKLAIAGANNIVATEDEKGMVVLVIDPKKDKGRTKKGEGKNLDVACTYGWRPLEGLIGYSIMVQIIKRPE